MHCTGVEVRMLVRLLLLVMLLLLLLVMMMIQRECRQLDTVAWIEETELG